MTSVASEGDHPTTAPGSAAVGELVGRFDFVVQREEVWPVDWAAYLDEPVYQDDVVATREGFADIPVPIGGLIFFSHLDDTWRERAGIDYRTSLAAERRCEFLRLIHVGDRVTGETVVAERFTKTRGFDGAPLYFVRLATEYRVATGPAMREAVLYVTVGAAS